MGRFVAICEDTQCELDYSLESSLHKNMLIIIVIDPRLVQSVAVSPECSCIPACFLVYLSEFRA